MNATGEMIAALGETAFPQALAAALQGIASFDYMVVFGYQGVSRPLDVFDTFPAEKRVIFVEDYQAGPYLLDPFYLASTHSNDTGLFRLKDLAPDRFYQGEYFRNYYVQTGLAEEIGFLISLSEGVRMVVSLMRSDRVFSAKEVKDLRQYWPIIQAAARNHWRDLDQAFDRDDKTRSVVEAETSIERAFLTFGEGVLTPREREVVEYTLKGHSAEATGRILGIASGTVRIHRKNVYAKLRIGSQGELFSKFISALNGESQAR